MTSSYQIRPPDSYAKEVEVGQSESKLVAVRRERAARTDGWYGEKAPKGLVLVRDVKLEGGRQRHPSGGVSAKEMVIGLEGVELGADGKVRGRHHRAGIDITHYRKNIITIIITFP